MNKYRDRSVERIETTLASTHSQGKTIGHQHSKNHATSYCQHHLSCGRSSNQSRIRTISDE